MRNRGRGRKAGRPTGLGVAHPRVLSASVNGDTLVIVVSEAVVSDASSSKWTMRIAGSDPWVGLNGDIAPNDPITSTTTITFNGCSPLVTNGQVCTLEYNEAIPPQAGGSNGKVYSPKTGLEILSFYGLPVTNNTP